MSNGGVKNAEAAAASSFELYAGDFSCDDDISFENLLQLDNDIDKPPAAASHQGGTASPAAICRQPAPTASTSGSSAVPPTQTDTVVYLLTTTGLRPPISAGGPGFDAIQARNDVRPLLRFQIAKRPTTAAVVGYGVELGAPVVTVASTPQLRAAAVGIGGAGCDLASITSIGDRVASVPAVGSPSTSDAELQRRLALTTAFNGDLTASTQRSFTAAVVAGCSPRPVKPNQPLVGSVSVGGSSKSKSSAAADARQTVQEKNAYEYERVMDILRYYRELVVERKLPGACLPCKRRKSKPLVSAEQVTPVSTRPVVVPPPPPTSTIPSRPVTVPATQYIRPVMMSPWRGQTPTASGQLLPLSQATTTASSTPTSVPAAPQTPADSDARAATSAVHDEPPSRPLSVELGTMQLNASDDDLLQCVKDLNRSCRSAPGPCMDDDEQKPSVDGHKRASNVFGRRRRTLRRSVDLRRFVGRTPAFVHRNPKAPTAQGGSDSGVEMKEEQTDSISVWLHRPPLPVKHISTQTTDTVVVKWTKAHLAISGPYQSWT